MDNSSGSWDETEAEELRSSNGRRVFVDSPLTLCKSTFSLCLRWASYCGCWPEPELSCATYQLEDRDTRYSGCHAPEYPNCSYQQMIHFCELAYREQLPQHVHWKKSITCLKKNCYRRLAHVYWKELLGSCRRCVLCFDGRFLDFEVARKWGYVACAE